MLNLSRACCCIALIFYACQPKEEISIIFGGDVMLDRGIRAQIETKGVKYFTENIKTAFKKADFTIVNLECPATDIHAPLTKKFIFRAETSWLTELRDAGITHCILANNHSYDHGRDGLISTNENLLKADLTPVGYGLTQIEACKPVLINKNGLEVAIFSSVTLPLESWMYLEDHPGMCQATVEDLKKNISLYQDSHPDSYIIVTLHWGIEYQRVPSTDQRTQARDLIAAGADAIIGHHPHVVQSFERIDGKPVFYSIGNLIFDNRNPITHEGILVKVVVRKNESAVEIIPYQAKEGKPFIMDTEKKSDLFSRLQKISDELPD